MTPGGGVDGGDDRGKAKAGTQTATTVQGLGWDWMGLGGGSAGPGLESLDAPAVFPVFLFAGKAGAWGSASHRTGTSSK